jgi:hypothetical protein
MMCRSGLLPHGATAEIAEPNAGRSAFLVCFSKFT